MSTEEDQARRSLCEPVTDATVLKLRLLPHRLASRLRHSLRYLDPAANRELPAPPDTLHLLCLATKSRSRLVYDLESTVKLTTVQ